MKCIVIDTRPDRPGTLGVIPVPDVREKTGGEVDGHPIVEVPGPMISALQKAHVDVEIAEAAIRKHLGKT